MPIMTPRSFPLRITIRWAGAILLPVMPVLSTPVWARAGRQDNAVVVYSVREGDTLFALADRYFLKPGDAVTVQRINRIAEPRRIPVGFRLRVPWRLLRQEPIEARVRTFSGPVRIVTAGRSADATPGMTLGEGSDVETGANAFVTLDLPDGSAISLPSQSRVRIGLMRKTMLTGSVERRFDIQAGRARAVVTPMTDPHSSFRVSTPVAVSAVRGTEFRMGYDPEQNRATTEVIVGKVAVSSSDAKAASMLVPAGFGAVAEKASGVTEPLALLPAPELVAPTSKQRDTELSFALKPLAGAAGYRLQIARDAGFLDVLTEKDSVETSISSASLPNGIYFLRVAAIDVQGLEGQSDAYAFERRLNRVSGSMETEENGGRRQYLFRWMSEGGGTHQYRFQLSRCGEEGAPLIDQSGMTTQGIVVSDLTGGAYCWRVQSLQFEDGKVDAAWSEPQMFRTAD